MPISHATVPRYGRSSTFSLVVAHYLTWVEKYGLFFVTAYALGLFTPELTPKVALMDLDLEASVAAKSGSNALKQLFWMSALLHYMVLAARDGARVLRYRFVPVLLAIGFLVLLSAFVSSFPGTAIKRAIFQIMFLIVVVLSIYFAFKRGTLGLCITRAVYAMIAMVGLAIVVGGGMNHHGELAGYAKAKNVMGHYIASAFILLMLAEFVEHRRIRHSIKLKLILMGMLVLTVSKTSITVVTMIVMASHLPLLANMLASYALIWGWFTLFVILPSISYLLNMYWHLAMEVSPSFFTQRGEIWDACYSDMAGYDKYLFGFGYGSYFATAEIPFSFDIKWSFLRFISSAHNGYIEVLLQFGFIFSMLLMFLLLRLMGMIRFSKLHAMLFFPLIHNTTESSFVRDHHTVWFLFLAICLCGALIHDVHQRQARAQWQMRRQQNLSKSKTAKTLYLQDRPDGSVVIGPRQF